MTIMARFRLGCCCRRPMRQNQNTTLNAGMMEGQPTITSDGDNEQNREWNATYSGNVVLNVLGGAVENLRRHCER